MVNWLERSCVHLLNCVRSLFRVLSSHPLTPDDLPALRFVLLSGERITTLDLHRWFETFAERIKVVNLWGPSETTMVKTFHFIQKRDFARERIPVGRPMNG